MQVAYLGPDALVAADGTGTRLLHATVFNRALTD